MQAPGASDLLSIELGFQTAREEIVDNEEDDRQVAAEQLDQKCVESNSKSSESSVG